MAKIVTKTSPVSPDAWPALPYTEWADTLATLHMWTQIVGKLRLTLSPWLNQSWHVTSYVTARGMTTSAIPYGSRLFQIEFDFIDHALNIAVSDGQSRTLALKPQTVADFYHELMASLDSLGISVQIHEAPNEVETAIPFAEDTTHKAYDKQQANLLWRALLQSARVFGQFRARFAGKCSPVHFFWGAMDLAVTRFSGRPAPVHPGGVPNCPNWVMVEAYSEEVSSAGFWPGNAEAPEPIFYSYIYPAPDGFADSAVRPDAAFWLADLGEFALPYEAVRGSDDPDAALTEFLQSTYAAAADMAGWNRARLERPAGYTPTNPSGSDHN
jgi:hypothetical protein